jgi:hypothetical protein
MSVSRRRFLKSGAFLSAALILKPGTFVVGQNSHWSNPLNSHSARAYSREMFEPYVGDVFRVRVGKQTIDLKLQALESVSYRSGGITTGKSARTDCFSLRFHSATPLPATGGIHKLHHGKLGSFDLFMVQSKEGRKFLGTAIINQLV